MKTSDQHAEKWRGVPPSNGLKAGEKLKKKRRVFIAADFANLSALFSHPT